MDRVMPFHFNEKKAIQAMAVLLKRSGPDLRHNYLRALKLLYFADRRFIELHGRPITGDRIVAMENGPVLSLVCDRIRGTALQPSEWEKYIVTVGFDVELKADPGNGDLSPAEIEILNEVWDENAGLDQWEVVDKSHKLPEYVANRPPEKSAKPIPFRSIMEALGQVDRIEDAIMQASESAAIPGFLRG